MGVRERGGVREEEGEKVMRLKITHINQYMDVGNELTAIQMIDVIIQWSNVML